MSEINQFQQALVYVSLGEPVALHMVVLYYFFQYMKIPTIFTPYLALCFVCAEIIHWSEHPGNMPLGACYACLHKADIMCSQHQADTSSKQCQVYYQGEVPFHYEDGVF